MKFFITIKSNGEDFELDALTDDIENTSKGDILDILLAAACELAHEIEMTYSDLEGGLRHHFTSED